MPSDGTPTRRDFLLATLSVAVTLVALYGGPVYREAAARELGWSMGTAAGAFALGYLVALPVPVLVGLVADRLGARVVPVGAMATTALALFAASASREVWQWYLTAGVGLTVGYYAAYAGAGLLASVGEKRGSSLGLVLGVGYGIGLAAGPSLAQMLVDGVGWRAALASVGIAAALVAVVATQQARRPRVGRRVGAPAPAAVAEHHGGRRAVLLAGFFVGNMLIAVFDESVYQYGYAYGSALGLSGTSAAGVISLVSVALTVGMVVGGSLSDAVCRRPVLVVAALASAGTLVGLLGSSAGALWVWGALFGLALGASLAVRSAAWADAFAGPRLGRDLGIVAAGYPAGAALATSIGAAWLDRGGSFVALYWAAAAAALLWGLLGAALTGLRPEARPSVSIGTSAVQATPGSTLT